jgi:hypothetical protein
MPDASPPEANAAPTPEARKFAEDRFHHKPIVEKYPSHLAGRPISKDPSQSSEETYRSSMSESTAMNPYAPFKSKVDWEIAKWAKFRGAGSTAFTDLLNIGGVCLIAHNSIIFFLLLTPPRLGLRVS